MDAVEPQLPEIKKQLEELKMAQTQTTDETAREELKKRIEGFEEALKLFDPQSDTNKQLKKMLELVDSPQFDADTFWNWLKREGAVIGAAIGCAVAAGIAVGTAGIGSPLLALAVGASYLVGEADMTLRREDVADIPASTTEQHIYHELVHHSQATLIVRALKQEIEAILPESQHNTEAFKKNLMERYKILMGSSLNEEFCQQVLDTPSRRLSPAEIDRAFALADSFKQIASVDTEEVRSSFDAANGFLEKISSHSDDALTEGLRTIKNNPAMRQRLFSVDTVEELPAHVRQAIEDVETASPKFNPAKVREKLVETIDARVTDLGIQLEDSLEAYEAQLHEQEAYLAHESIELAMQIRAMQVSAAQTPRS